MRRTERFAVVCLGFLVLLSIAIYPQQAAFFNEVPSPSIEVVHTEGASLRSPSRLRPRFSKTGKDVGGKAPTNPPVATPKRIDRCPNDAVANRTTNEYGAISVANPKKALVPAKCSFMNQAMVEQFQRRAGIAMAIVGGIRIELQPKAMEAFLQARNEAQKNKLALTPRGTDASRRSYLQVDLLWRTRVNASLAHWVEKGKITPKAASRLRSLDSSAQVLEVLSLEEKGLFFGKGFGKSILQSVAAPGTSQHLSMLALDIEQHYNPSVRAILAKHGWFQTISNYPLPYVRT